MRDRVAVCVVGQPRSAAQTVPMIRRHVLNVLDYTFLQIMITFLVSIFRRRQVAPGIEPRQFPFMIMNVLLNLLIVLGNVIKLCRMSWPAASGIGACAGFYPHLVTP